MIDLDRVLLHPSESTGQKQTTSEYITKMMQQQDRILEAVQGKFTQKEELKQLRKESDAVQGTSSHQMPEGVPIQVGDWILVGYDPANKVQRRVKYRAKLRGPYKVLHVEKGSVRYHDGMRDHIIPTQWAYHYLFPPGIDPLTESIRGTKFKVIDRVVSHTGEKKDGQWVRASLQFLVHWVGMGEADRTYCSYAQISWADKFHEYCREHKLTSLIPDKFKKAMYYSKAVIAPRLESFAAEKASFKRNNNDIENQLATEEGVQTTSLSDSPQADSMSTESSLPPTANSMSIGLMLTADSMSIESSLPEKVLATPFLNTNRTASTESPTIPPKLSKGKTANNTKNNVKVTRSMSLKKKDAKKRLAREKYRLINVK